MVDEVKTPGNKILDWAAAVFQPLAPTRRPPRWARAAFTAFVVLVGGYRSIRNSRRIDCPPFDPVSAKHIVPGQEIHFTPSLPSERQNMCAQDLTADAD
jgi:hypothetical protein